jgi:hypothetical protein
MWPRALDDHVELTVRHRLKLPKGIALRIAPHHPLRLTPKQLASGLEPLSWRRSPAKNTRVT